MQRELSYSLPRDLLADHRCERATNVRAIYWVADWPGCGLWGSTGALGTTVVFELFDDMFEPASFLSFVELVSATSRYGRCVLEQVFSLLGVATVAGVVVGPAVGYPYTGITLRNMTKQYVQPLVVPDSPFDRSRCGELHLLTSGELCRRLLLDQPPRVPEQIIMRVLRVGLHGERLDWPVATGADKGKAVQVAMAAGPEEVGAVAGAAAVGNNNIAGGVGLADHEEPDLLSLLHSSTSAQVRNGRRQSRGVRDAPAATTHATATTTVPA